MSVVIDGTSGISSPDYEVDGVTGQIYPIVRGTAVTASGTSVDFTGIPSWVRRITVMFSGVSTNGTSNIQVQIGSGSFITSGYSSQSGLVAANSAQALTATSGFAMLAASAANTFFGNMVLTNISGNLWVSTHTIGSPGSVVSIFGGGGISLSGTLDRVRITTVNGTDNFDAGTINIIYE